MRGRGSWIAGTCWEHCLWRGVRGGVLTDCALALCAPAAAAARWTACGVQVRHLGRTGELRMAASQQWPPTCVAGSRQSAVGCSVSVQDWTKIENEDAEGLVEVTYRSGSEPGRPPDIQVIQKKMAIVAWQPGPNRVIAVPDEVGRGQRAAERASSAVGVTPWGHNPAAMSPAAAPTPCAATGLQASSCIAAQLAILSPQSLVCHNALPLTSVG
jgi:hypothetical protein